MIRDRRSGRDRRDALRFSANIEIEWESLVGRQRGNVSDISMTGCFVLCSGEVEESENVRLFFPAGRGNVAAIWGEVVNHVYEIGYAVRFIELGNGERLFLERLIHHLSQTSQPHDGRR